MMLENKSGKSITVFDEVSKTLFKDQKWKIIFKNVRESNKSNMSSREIKNGSVELDGKKKKNERISERKNAIRVW